MGNDSPNEAARRYREQVGASAAAKRCPAAGDPAMREEPSQVRAAVPQIGRREFVATSASAAGLMLIDPRLVRGTAANSAVRLGLLGCGSRGADEMTSFLNSTSGRLVALGDLFPDQLSKAKVHFDQVAGQKGYSGPEMLFRGPDAYQQMANASGIDAILITTPPYFHPDHLETVVAAGKHVYCEKPVAVDVYNAKRVLRIGEQAQGRLSLDVGFQIRSAPPFAEMVRRIHSGALGNIACAQAYYYAAPNGRPKRSYPTAAEARLRNWIWDRVLSGDILVEQGIHVVDICNWVLQSHPIRAQAVGGKKTNVHPGDTFDHYVVAYEYPNGVHVSFNSTQFDNGWWDVCERFFGDRGISESHYTGGVRIYGEEPWEWSGGQPAQSAGTFSQSGVFHDALEHADSEKEKAFIESITSGSFHNQAAAGVESALTAMLGREAAYRKGAMTWDELLASDERWDAGLDIRQFA